MVRNVQKVNEDDFMLVPLLESLRPYVNNFVPDNITDYVKIFHPSEYKKSHSLFAFTCNNDDLQPNITKKDTIIIHPQKSAKIGDVVAFETPYSINFGKIAKSEKYNQIYFVNNKLKYTPGKLDNLGIIGKVISVQRDF